MSSTEKVYLPLDFNSLCNLRGGSLMLTDYYVDYAFSGSDVEPREDLPVIFYDKYWLPKESAVPSLEAVLSCDENKSWRATIKGQIFLSMEIPSSRYTSAFIGSSSFLMENGQRKDVQKLGDNPQKDVLGGTSCFACAPDSSFPDFTKIVGMDANEIERFFTFSDVKMLPPKLGSDGRIEDSTLMIRGGRNKND